MQQSTTSGLGTNYTATFPAHEAHSSGVSWAAVVAGAFVAAALSLTLLALGAGFGLLTVSPWSSSRVSTAAVDSAAIIWLILTQLVASGAGGYLAGRLRIKWAAIHSDEVYFRDTAHGFLVWAVAVVITAAFLGSAATALVGGVETNGEMPASENAYFVETLFRSAPSATAASPATGPTANAESGVFLNEAASILARAISEGGAASDQAYLAQLVGAKTGLSQQDATQRVNDVVGQARQAAETARKTTARLLLWTFLALLIGAFCASYAATIGGRQRDNLKAV